MGLNDTSQTDLRDFDLVAAAAHELKTPLTIISGTASMIHDGYATDKKTRQDYLQRILQSSDRLLNTIDSLIDLSQTQHDSTMQLQTVLVRPAIENVLVELEPMLSLRGQATVVKVSTRAKSLYAEERLLHRALFNLIENASKYSSDGSTVSVTVRKSQNRIRFEVRDQGVGIRKADISKLFRAFGKIKQPVAAHAGSNGLGLYVSQTIAQAHGGRITASPCRGGSIFCLELPVVHQLSLFAS